MRAVIVGLVGVSIGLMLVGFVSGTPIRHTVQVVPSLLALAIVFWRPGSAAPAALAVFVFWLFAMSEVWLFLFGLPSFVNGHFPPVEIGLSVVIGASTLIGIIGSMPRLSALGWLRGAGTFLASLAFVFLCFWLSIQPSLARI